MGFFDKERMAKEKAEAEARRMMGDFLLQVMLEADLPEERKIDVEILREEKDINEMLDELTGRVLIQKSDQYPVEEKSDQYPVEEKRELLGFLKYIKGGIETFASEFEQKNK